MLREIEPWAGESVAFVEATLAEWNALHPNEAPVRVAWGRENQEAQNRYDEARTEIGPTLKEQRGRVSAAWGDAEILVWVPGTTMLCDHGESHPKWEPEKWQPLQQHLDEAIKRHRCTLPGHCRKCGYTLRGISEPRCPECGEVI